MFNKLTAVAENITGLHPLDMRNKPEFYVANLTNDKELEYRLEIRVNRTNFINSLDELGNIQFHSTKYIGIIIENESQINDWLDALIRIGRSHHARVGDFIRGMCFVTFFLIQNSENKNTVLEQARRVLEIKNNRFNDEDVQYAPTVYFAGVRVFDDVPKSQTADEIICWLYNTKVNPTDFKDSAGRVHNAYFTKTDSFMMIKSLMNPSIEYIILNTLWKNLNRLSTNNFNPEINTQKLAYQKEKLLTAIDMQRMSDNIINIIRKYTEYLPVKYETETRMVQAASSKNNSGGFFGKLKGIFSGNNNSSAATSVNFLKVNSDAQLIKDSMLRSCFNKVDSEKIYHYAFNCFSTIYNAELTPDQADSLTAKVKEIVSMLISDNLSFIREGYLNEISTDATVREYRNFVNNYNSFNQKIRISLNYWNSIISVPEESYALLKRAGDRFLSDNLEFDYPEEEFKNSLETVQAGELPLHKLEMDGDGMSFYNALPSENAAIELGGKAFYIMKHDVILEEA